MKHLSLLFVLLWLTNPLAAQPDTTQEKTPQESPLVKQLKKIATDGAIKSRREFSEERMANRQRIMLEYARNLNQQAKLLLKKAIDTNHLNQFLKDTKKSLEIVKDGIWINPGSNQTQRNLTVSAAVLTELSARLARQKQLLDNYAAKLTAIKLKIDSLSNDPSVYALPSDSAGLIKYVKRMYVTAKEMAPVDSALEKATANLEELQLRTDLMAYELRSVQGDIDIYSSRLSAHTFDQEFPYIWTKPVKSRPLAEILAFSIAKESMMLRFYVENHLLSLLLLFILIICSWYFLRSLKYQLHQESLLSQDYNEQLVVRYPLLSAILIVLSIFQFVFPSPPFIFNTVLWVVSAICLWLIFHQHISPYWQRFWTVIVLLFIAASAENFILQASRPERYLMLALAACGSIYAAFILTTVHRIELREKKIKYAIMFLFILLVASILFNICGRFNISKTLLISGYIGVVTAIVFLWVIRLINQGLTLAFKAYKQPSAQLFYVNFERVGENTPWPLYLIFVLGWIMLVARNFYSFKRFSVPVIDFLTSDRTIGSYSFSIMGLLVFILILFCSFVLSRLVSYFATEPDSFHQSGEKRKKPLGSWLLIVRIFIITIGLFFAFAAAGIPLDKFAIVLGALGVGVGLGLQGLVNNLISGLIISFERPVNVGDIIEINGKIATMKSIGFRSSIVTSSDGPNVIIPNGELLSNQLVNYSMSKNIKKCSLMVGVAYDSNLENIRNQLKQILQDDERILHFPAPDAFFKEFGDNAIEMEVIYWVRNIKEYFPLRSDLISRITTAFKAEGIVIPFAQQEIFVKNLPGDHKEK
ncbi:potassium efflux system protein [Pedobacter africanus]|uniref:Small-conductance mechanosensitive channel n=1 Tax=Pedobacter africanus TaxID=151894 RepID=A0ACC6KR01_9SPHI|nr:mechanosensitive ion channel domain-containing protein [Pedobacter africanus]MDR6781552.1 small-conductance mechanosensitive channel [Pedobacter africanus]